MKLSRVETDFKVVLSDLKELDAVCKIFARTVFKVASRVHKELVVAELMDENVLCADPIAGNVLAKNVPNAEPICRECC